MPTHQALRDAMSLIATGGVLRNAGPLLDASAEKAAIALREAVLTEVPAFSTSGNPEILPSLAQHAGEHMQEIRRLARRRRNRRFRFRDGACAAPGGAIFSARGYFACLSLRPPRSVALAEGRCHRATTTEHRKRDIGGRGFLDRVHEHDQHDHGGGICRANAHSGRGRRETAGPSCSTFSSAAMTSRMRNPRGC